MQIKLFLSAMLIAFLSIAFIKDKVNAIGPQIDSLHLVILSSDAGRPRFAPIFK